MKHHYERRKKLIQRGFIFFIFLSIIIHFCSLAPSIIESFLPVESEKIALSSKEFAELEQARIKAEPQNIILMREQTLREQLQESFNSIERFSPR